MRCVALSDSRVIQLVNQNFVPLGVNVTRDGFPPELPALKLIEGVYKSHWRFEFGFAACMMLDQEGGVFLGSTVTKHGEKEADQFSAERFLAELQRSLVRFERVKEIKRIGGLRSIGMWLEYWRDLAAGK